MTKYALDSESIGRAISRMDRAIERAQQERQRLKELVEKARELIDQAETVLTNHAGRISQNETDIQAGKDKLIDHEQRIRALEGG